MRRLVLAAGSLVADFELAHGGLARTELNEQIARSPFTRTWALYQRVAAPEETLAPRAAPPAAFRLRELRVTGRRGAAGCAAAGGDAGGGDDGGARGTGASAAARRHTRGARVGLTATTHRVRLDGDAWARVLEACPDLLKQEFTSDVCDATSLPPTSMRRLVLAAGSLVADFELAHGGLARTELNEQIARSPSPARGRCTSASLRRKRRWPPRCAACRPSGLRELRVTGRRGAAAVLRREGTPEVATMVAHEARVPALQRVGTPEEPRVGLTATTHRVRLDGDAWARVLEACPDLLKQEFTSDVCDATSLPPTSMRRLVLAAGSLVADFELAHGGLARTELNEQIARSPFTRTWALYQRVAAPEETLAPRAAPPAALQDSESFASLDVEEPPAVLRREGTPEVATMVAHEARVPALQRVGTPEEPRVGLTATTHRVRLDGDAWARVLEACPDLLKQEFTSDVCDATSLPPTSMRRLVLAAGSLVADFELAHGGLARTELNEQIARSPFTRTWALYQRVAAPEETLAPRAAPPAALQDSESFASLDVEEPPAVLRREGTPEVATMVAHEARVPALQRVGTPEEPRVGLTATTHRVRLDGDAWARVLEACPDLLKQEFTSDVCDATSLPPTSMRRLVLAAGSLVADFELAHGGLARTELNEQIARSPFTRTWALYQRVAAPEETLAPALRRLPPFRTPRASRHWTSRSRRLCCGGRGRRRWRRWWRTRHGCQRCSASAHPRSRAWA
ncbi:Flagellar Member 8 [Leishmania guyanensis]